MSRYMHPVHISTTPWPIQAVARRRRSMAFVDTTRDGADRSPHVYAHVFYTRLYTCLHTCRYLSLRMSTHIFAQVTTTGRDLLPTQYPTSTRFCTIADAACNGKPLSSAAGSTTPNPTCAMPSACGTAASAVYGRSGTAALPVYGRSGTARHRQCMDAVARELRWQLCFGAGSESLGAIGAIPFCGCRPSGCRLCLRCPRSTAFFVHSIQFVRCLVASQHQRRCGPCAQNRHTLLVYFLHFARLQCPTQASWVGAGCVWWWGGAGPAAAAVAVAVV